MWKGVLIYQEKGIKNNNSGFVLAETLVVTVFLMAIFVMIYINYLPLVGEYEKRETYDDVDGKYAVNGGRVLIVVGSGKTLKEAQEKALADVKKIKCDSLFYRSDIGYRAL